MGLRDILKHSWNVFANRSPTRAASVETYGSVDRPHRSTGNGCVGYNTENTIIASIYNRFAIDVSNYDIKHIKNDKDGNFLKEMNSGLNTCLNFKANIDQTAREFICEVVTVMLTKGVVAIVPVDTKLSPSQTAGYDIMSLRTGYIAKFYPREVDVNVYNDRTGKREVVRMGKEEVAIITNPYYDVMNTGNTTFQRLRRKLNIMDKIDEYAASGKLDLLIQLPYTINGTSKRELVNKKKAQIEMDLNNSKYGVGFIEATDKVIQLNRPIENNMLAQIKFLKDELYSELNINQEILDGTADEQRVLNYQHRTIKPMVQAIVEAMRVKFLSKTAVTQGQDIKYYTDPFDLVPLDKIADASDKFTRNEIMSSNEIRAKIGMMPSKQPGADELRNKNIAQPNAPISSDGQNGYQTTLYDKVRKIFKEDSNEE